MYKDTIINNIIKLYCHCTESKSD